MDFLFGVYINGIINVMRFFDAYRGLRKEMYVLFFSKVVTCVGAMVWTMLTFLLSEKLLMSASEIALWLVIYSAVQIGIQIAGGRIADKCDKRMVIYICDFIEVLLYFYCFFAPLTKSSIIVFLVCTSIENISGSSYGALVADLSSSQDREKANSLLYLGTNLGMMVSPVLAGFLVKDYPNVLFLCAGTATLLAFILELIYLKDVTPEKNVSEYEDAKDDSSIFEVIKSNIPVMFFILIVSFQWYVYNAYSFYVPLDLVRVYGSDGSVIYGFLSTVNCITVVVCTAFITKITKGIKEINKYILGIIFFLLGYIIFILFINNKYICFVSFFVFTIGEIFASLVCDPFISRRVPSSHRGRVFAIYGVLNSIVYVLFQNPLASVYDNKGSLATWNIILFMHLLIIIALLTLKKFDKKRYPKIYEPGYLDDEEKS